jgi:hypothetical protein
MNERIGSYGLRLEVAGRDDVGEKAAHREMLARATGRCPRIRRVSRDDIGGA